MTDASAVRKFPKLRKHAMNSDHEPPVRTKAEGPAKAFRALSNAVLCPLCASPNVMLVRMSSDRTPLRERTYALMCAGFQSACKWRGDAHKHDWFKGAVGCEFCVQNPVAKDRG